jgi:hypothetical protein
VKNKIWGGKVETKREQRNFGGIPVKLVVKNTRKIKREYVLK